MSERRRKAVLLAVDVGFVLASLVLYPVQIVGDVRERMRELARRARRRFELPRDW